MVKPIRVDLPYPEIGEVLCDKRSATIISPAYCGVVGELSAVLGYTYQSINFAKLADEEMVDLLLGISLTEMHHFKILAQTLCSLGVDPVFTTCPPYHSEYYSTSGITFSKTPEKMLMDAITGEMVAVNEYKRMLKNLSNERVATIIERILLDEELHVKVLKEKFDKFNIKIL